MIGCKREIFGPLLPVKTYRNADEVAATSTLPTGPWRKPVHAREAAAGVYINCIMPGGVSVNEGILHVGQHDPPFGGVSASGMGHYHGYEGCHLLKLRPVFYQARRSRRSRCSSSRPACTRWILDR